ncbi:EAL domain-containing protein [Sphingomonas sp. ASV193]|uniref:EAL domain-containing protein n=1 Tax=Sphingomonas sp. ASV193 TaxID=3144405 RepID=UPI0032E90863
MRRLADRTWTKLHPQRATLWAVLLFGLIFGLLGIGTIGDDVMRTARNRLHPVAASRDIVVVGIDDRSQKTYGSWPWKRALQAQLIDQVSKAGARKIAVDLEYDFPTDEVDDRALGDVLRRSPNVYLAMRSREGRDTQLEAKLPLARYLAVAKAGDISFYYNFQSIVWREWHGNQIGQSYFPSFSSILAGQESRRSTGTFPIDYRTTIRSIPYISAADVLDGKAAAQLAGRTVLIGTNSPSIGDQFLIPGDARHGGMFIHALAAETLKRGTPVDIGWIAPFLFVALLVALALNAVAVRWRATYIGVSVGVLLGAPYVLEQHLIFVQVMPALAILVVTIAILGRRTYKARGLINASTGLPNLNALKLDKSKRDRPLIVARLINYPALAATLNDKDEVALVKQVVSRLAVGNRTVAVHQGDEGVFAWFAEEGTAIGHHVEALYALFRSPARIGKQKYDLALAFGVEIGSRRSTANRLASALVAADEAAAEGLKWKLHDPERFRDEEWRLSLLAQIDQAIDNGEIWVAYQPQVELATGRIHGAEALARWTHPEKGPISPSLFVAAAEQHGRIDRLTLFMIDRAVAALARCHAAGHEIRMAVNLSAKTLARQTLSDEVRAILAEHQVDARFLTLELTETAALAGDGSDLAPLMALRRLGVKISIDDYGTGLSTLDYLKKVPASEIKIDQSFIKAMNDNRSDYIMVQSTIALAHSLGRQVVAEGIENAATLEAVTAMSCDFGQGFHVGRPTSIDGLIRRLPSLRKGRAA